MSKNPSRPAVDCNTTLCLACSSSLPPSKSKLSAGLFITSCCTRPICHDCLASNPRLARYDPCLACLGGVGAINAGNNKGKQVQRLNINVDGAVRDEDTFVVGDDEDESGDEQTGGPDCRPSSPPPPYVASLPAMPMDELEPSTPEVSTASEASHTNTANGSSTEISTPSPSQYYIKPGDNLLGIALRFGVNGRELCRLNNLPPSTLTTTPHILHTRVSLTLPLSARSKSKSPLNGADPTADKEQEARITRQRAEKRLQTLTKETI